MSITLANEDFRNVKSFWCSIWEFVPEWETQKMLRTFATGESMADRTGNAGKQGGDENDKLA
jgi:hypothetical protein